MNIYTLPKTFIAALFTIVSLFSVKCATAQLEGDELKNAIDAKNFSFIVTHESGGNFAIGNYYLHVVNDSLSAVLPFSGQSNSAAYTTDDNGINIHTKNFTYKPTISKKGKYVIDITLKNDRVTRSFSLQVNKNGVAMLVANCINRDNAIYTGVIQDL